MFLNEILQQGNQVIGTGRHSAIIHDHLTGGLAVRADYNTAGKSVPVHVWVVADIILGHHKWLLALGQHDLALRKPFAAVSVRFFVGNVMDPHQYITTVIHGLKHFHELILGGHD